jgi:hypothetical protein
MQVKGLECATFSALHSPIENLPLPTSVKQIRSFLELVGFYRRFIKDFSKISRPLFNYLPGILLSTLMMHV